MEQPLIRGVASSAPSILPLPPFLTRHFSGSISATIKANYAAMSLRQTAALAERRVSFKSLRHSFYFYGSNVMHAVMREYSGSGADKLFDLLENNKAEVKEVIMLVNGFVSYTLVRTARGGFSVTICQDKAGADESVRVAHDWIAKNASDAGAAAPTVSEGAVILHL